VNPDLKIKYLMKCEANYKPAKVNVDEMRSVIEVKLSALGEQEYFLPPS
jgi:hypothetical protein